MAKYINKDALVAEIEERINKEIQSCATDSILGYSQGCIDSMRNVLSLINTLEVEEIEDYIIPKHSYFEQIYHCGSEPRWKIGDVLAAYEFYRDHEGEDVYGKITDVKMDEDEDWLYTFENGNEYYENMLISDEAYKKN